MIALQRSIVWVTLSRLAAIWRWASRGGRGIDIFENSVLFMIGTTATFAFVCNNSF